eukprot:scaffold259_cov118-Isochrysis_galbana.AAC.6
MVTPQPCARVRASAGWRRAAQARHATLSNHAAPSLAGAPHDDLRCRRRLFCGSADAGAASAGLDAGSGADELHQGGW